MTSLLAKAVEAARLNPVRPLGRNSISRFAAILTDGWQTFVGLNSYKTHPLQAKFGSNSKSIHCHAELDAIIQAVRALAQQSGSSYRDVTNLKGWSMYVARVTGDGKPALAKPCAGCQRALQAFNISHTEWTS